MSKKTGAIVTTTKHPDGYDVYIGRAFRMYAKVGPKNPVPGLFGNPFKGDDWEEKFTKYLREKFESDSYFALRLMQLKGKRIACFCHGPGETEPRCHGDVIAEFLATAHLAETFKL